MATVIDAKDRYYSVREVAEAVGVSVCRVHQFLAEGRLRGTKLGNVYAIPESEVERLKRSPRAPGRPKSQ